MLCPAPIQVEFLEKVEAQSSQRIQELESLERSYREQLESRDSAHSPGADSRSLQNKLAAAEREIEKLVARNNELEENEEILRENWRRVADEDANRLQCLEEKVRMLTLANQDLKHKVAEAQDFVVINSGPAQGSLADELSASSKRGQARPPGDGPMSGGSDDDSGDESPRKRVSIGGHLETLPAFFETTMKGNSLFYLSPSPLHPTPHPYYARGAGWLSSRAPDS